MLQIVHVCEQWSHGMDTSQYCAGALEAAADRARDMSRDVEVGTEMLAGNVIESLIGESVSATDRSGYGQCQAWHTHTMEPRRRASSVAQHNAGVLAGDAS